MSEKLKYDNVHPVIFEINKDGKRSIYPSFFCGTQLVRPRTVEDKVFWMTDFDFNRHVESKQAEAVRQPDLFNAEINKNNDKTIELLKNKWFGIYKYIAGKKFVEKHYGKDNCDKIFK